MDHLLSKITEIGPKNEIMAKLGLVNENDQYLIVNEKSKKNDTARALHIGQIKHTWNIGYMGYM